jgi:hypothetical protein
MAKSDHTLDWMIDNYMPFFMQFGMDEGNLRRQYEVWKAKSSNHRVHDYLWYIFQILLAESAKQSPNELELYRNNFKIHCKMWEFRIKVEGKKANDIKQLVEESRVRMETLQAPSYIEIKVSSGHCCPYCDGLNGMVFSPEDVLENQYLASDKCTRERGCNCRYVSVVMRNDDGSLKIKELLVLSGKYIC